MYVCTYESQVGRKVNQQKLKLRFVFEKLFYSTQPKSRKTSIKVKFELAMIEVCRGIPIRDDKAQKLAIRA
jgi:hypothetical protein